jgi:hypothetical protein
MPFLQSDDHHVDSCWMTWNNPETRLKVTTYPMVHIGDPIYYERVSADLARCQYVLVEGVSWRLGDEKRPLWDLVAKNLGMAAQEKALRIPPSVTKLNIDMKRSEFRSHLFRLPIRYVAAIVFLRRLLWLLTLLPSMRAEMIRHGLLRRSRRESRENESPLRRFLVGSRDRRIAENLETFYRQHGRTDETRYVGIVFGAGHMPAISRALRQLGFQVGTRRWVEVLRIAQHGIRV